MTTKELEQKLADMQAQLNDLRRERAEILERLDTIPPMPVPAPIPPLPPKPPIEEGPRVFYPSETKFVMPSDTELEKLIEIVLARFPFMTAKGDDFFRDFKNAFIALGFIRRGDQLDRKRYISYWFDIAEEQLKAMGRWNTSMEGWSFCAAVAAHGDILFSRFDNYPSLGLKFGGSGQGATDAWRRVLDGEILTPIEPPKPLYNTPKTVIQLAPSLSGRSYD